MPTGCALTTFRSRGRTLPGPDDDRVASTLAEAQRIADALGFACRIPDKTPDFFACGGPAAEAYWAYFTPARISSLLAALEAVLKLAGDWEKEGRRLDDLAGETKDPQSRIAVSLRAQAFEDCALELRAAITAKLTGKETGDA